MADAVIFIGIPAAGKSTFFNVTFRDTHVRVNLDMLRTRSRERILLNACIEANQSFVIDNTNSTSAERRIYIEKAKEARFNVIAYFFVPDFTGSMKRNSRRKDRAPLPEVAIRSRLGCLQKPTYAEGFDEIFTVIPKDDRFEVVYLEGIRENEI